MLEGSEMLERPGLWPAQDWGEASVSELTAQHYVSDREATPCVSQTPILPFLGALAKPHLVPSHGKAPWLPTRWNKNQSL